MEKRFHILIEQDEDDGFIGKVPELPGCMTQGDSLDELMKNMKEAIELCLEDRNEGSIKVNDLPRFIGVQEITI